MAFHMSVVDCSCKEWGQPCDDGLVALAKQRIGGGGKGLTYVVGSLARDGLPQFDVLGSESLDLAR